MDGGAVPLPASPSPPSAEPTANGGNMPAGLQRFIPAAAILVAVLGACAIMVSPITPWPMAVAASGAVAVVCGAAILVVGLHRR